MYKKYQAYAFSSYLAQNKKLHDKFLGERIFILGDGSSLNEIDFASISNEYTMGCNFIMIHPEFKKLNLKFYALASSLRSISPLNDPKKPLVPTGTLDKAFSILKSSISNQNTDLFCDISLKKKFNTDVFKRSNVFYFASSADGMRGGVELDLTKQICAMDGSAFFMIYLSICMGFKNIYLCGFGYTYLPQQSGHFYDDWSRLDHGRVDERHLQLKEAAVNQGARICNIIPRGFSSPIYDSIYVDQVGDVLQN